MSGRAHQPWCSALVLGCDCGYEAMRMEAAGAFGSAWARCEALLPWPDTILELERYSGGYTAFCQALPTGFFGHDPISALTQLADAMERGGFIRHEDTEEVFREGWDEAD